MIRTLAFALAKALLNFARDKCVKAALPKVFARLDVELPYQFKYKQQPPTPSLVKGLIASAVSDAIGEPAEPVQTELVRLLYDPVQAAANLIKLRSRP